MLQVIGKNAMQQQLGKLETANKLGKERLEKALQELSCEKAASESLTPSSHDFAALAESWVTAVGHVDCGRLVMCICFFKPD